MSLDRTMLSFVVGASRFNYRVAGIALRHGHVLVCREDDDDYTMLPGGRVEMGEPSPVALAREIAEELHSVAITVALAYTVENFFERAGQQFHELAAYYRVDLPEAFPFAEAGVVFETEDEGHQLRFEWVDVAGDGLNRVNLLPVWIREKLWTLPASPEHLIMRETP
jgi:8-oxo-dGTP pyrophosphatase MutT (NUDIX family)